MVSSAQGAGTSARSALSESSDDDGPTKIRSGAPAQKTASSSNKEEKSDKEEKSAKKTDEKSEVKSEEKSKKTPEKKPSKKDDASAEGSQAKEDKSPKTEKPPGKKTPGKEKTPGKRKPSADAEESTPKAKKSKPVAEAAATPDEVRQRKAENYRKFLERQHAGPRNPGAREVPEVSKATHSVTAALPILYMPNAHKAR